MPRADYHMSETSTGQCPYGGPAKTLDFILHRAYSSYLISTDCLIVARRPDTHYHTLNIGIRTAAHETTNQRYRPFRSHLEPLSDLRVAHLRHTSANRLVPLLGEYFVFVHRAGDGCMPPYSI